MNPDFRFMSVWGYFQDSLYYDYDRNTQPHSRVHEVPPVTFQVSLAEADHVGWCWHIPLRETTSVGFVLPRETVVSLKQRFDSWEERFDFLVQSEPALHRLMKDAGLRDDGFQFINDFSGHSQELAGPGYFTVGDAAGFFDPVFSIGVPLGMFMGALAAWSAGQCLKKPENAARYQELFSRQVLARIEIARGLALPSYASAPMDEGRASRTLMFDSESEADLIRTAAKLSERSANLERLLA